MKTKVAYPSPSKIWFRIGLMPVAVLLVVLATLAQPTNAQEPNLAGKSKASPSNPSPLTSTGELTPKKGNLILDLGKGATMELIYCPPGKFIMGTDLPSVPNPRDRSAHPAREVTLTQGFYLGKYEVTQAQYQAVMRENPSFNIGENKPVDDITWHAAMDFCKKVSDLTGKKVRLPTEAEHVFAYRAGTETKYFWGTQLSEAEEYCCGTPQGKFTHEVGLLKSNPWGFYDICGNVGEWCSDWFHAGSYLDVGTVDPAGVTEAQATDHKKVLMGGSYEDDFGAFQYAWRTKIQANSKLMHRTGARVAITESPSTPKN